MDAKASVREKLRERFEAVERRIGAACARAGRSRSEVTLVAVTKTIAPELAALVPALGIFNLGENRPQSLWTKVDLLSREVRWHLIGHLQRNKIEKTLPLVHMIHSVDSLRLLKAIEQGARSVPVLLEVNASGEAAKQGFGPAELQEIVPALRDLRHVQVRGLMTMAALQDAEACRPTFAKLRQLRDQLRADLTGVHLIEHLSMGMSNDFEVAVEEGATLIRLGTVLFENL